MTLPAFVDRSPSVSLERGTSVPSVPPTFALHRRLLTLPHDVLEDLCMGGTPADGRLRLDIQGHDVHDNVVRESVRHIVQFWTGRGGMASVRMHVGDAAPTGYCGYDGMIVEVQGVRRPPG